MAHEKLSDDAWPVDLGLLIDLPTKLDWTMNSMEKTNTHVGITLGIWSIYLEIGKLLHSPNLKEMSCQVTEEKKLTWKCLICIMTLGWKQDPRYSSFWGRGSKDKFPLPTSCAIRVSAYLISVKWHFHMRQLNQRKETFFITDTSGTVSE